MIDGPWGRCSGAEGVTWFTLRALPDLRRSPQTGLARDMKTWIFDDRGLGALSGAEGVIWHNLRRSPQFTMGGHNAQIHHRA